MEVGLEPSYWSYMKLFNCIINSLEADNGVFTFRGRFLSLVEVVGIVVHVASGRTSISVILDDGTGLLAATVFFTTPDDRGSRASAHSRMDRSAVPETDSTLQHQTVEELLKAEQLQRRRHCERCLSLGALVSLRGRLRGTSSPHLAIDAVSALPDPSFEPSHWLHLLFNQLDD